MTTINSLFVFIKKSSDDLTQSISAAILAIRIYQTKTLVIPTLLMK